MRDLTAKFLDFDAANPHVYTEFEHCALKLIERGRKHYGAQGVIEHIRYETAIRTVGDEFKINNDFAAYYARMFEARNPQYTGFFSKRRSAADEVEAA
jgi:hypothetical protein